MIAARLLLSRREVQELMVRDAYSLHKLVYNLFPGNKRSFLYLDQGGDYQTRMILLISQSKPEIPEYGSLEIKTIPDNFLDYSSYAFSIRLNPVKRITGSSRILPIIGRENLLQWFLRRQQDWGFKVSSRALEVNYLGVQVIQQEKRKMTHNQAIFQGLLEVIDKDLFRKSFQEGIGRGKAFGFGLLQLRPLK